MEQTPSRTKFYIIVIVVLVIGGYWYYSQSKPSKWDEFGGGAMCTLVACGPNATIYSDVYMSFQQLQQSKLEVCQNTTCLTATFADLERPLPGTGRGVAVPSPEPDNYRGPHLTANFWAKENGYFYLEVKWQAGSADDLKNGDTYTAKLFNSAGGEIVDIQEKVTYQESYPNGRSCDRTPCRSAIIDKRF